MEVVQLVGADQLAARRADLENVRGIHVYSVQPRIPKVPAEIIEADKAACEDAMTILLQGDSQDSWLSDNRFSGIKAEGIKRAAKSASATHVAAPSGSAKSHEVST